MPEYIEREALINWLDRVDGIIADGTVEAPALYKQIVTDIKQFQTADVAEVRHGEWEEERWCDNFQHICSLCHRTVRVHPQSIAYVYCPYCGAKMDGKGEGE